MRKILLWILLFFIMTSFSTLALYDNGNLSLAWKDWIIETSVSFFIVILVFIFTFLYIFIRVFLLLINIPKWWKQRKKMKYYAQAESYTSKGLIALEYGDWQTAEKHLLKSVKYSESGLVHYLSVAKMAHNQQSNERKEQYLQKAKDLYPQDFITIGLVEARLLADAEPEKSIHLLQMLNEQSSNNKVIVSEYIQLAQKTNNWDIVENLLPIAKKLKCLDKKKLQQLDINLFTYKLKQAPNIAALESLWSFQTKKIRQNPLPLSEYVEQKMGWKQENYLAELIEQILKKHWDDRLVYQYGRLDSKNSSPTKRLVIAQKWLKNSSNNPVLLLTLGRLSCMSKLWGQGQEFLKRSLKQQAEVETFHVLAQCYESQGKMDRAALTYKEAILQLGKLDK